MRNKIIYFLVFLPIVLFAQQIYTDKDTLRIYGSDSLFVTNIGNSTLSLDSLYSVNPLYGYWMDIYIGDSSFTYFATYSGYIGWGPLELNLEANETAKFVFNYVDLCVICKQESAKEYFQDTLVFVSNSILNDATFIFVEGDGYLSSVNGEKSDIDSYFRLGLNYPNPFNLKTIITYALAKDVMVKIKIFDLNGSEIATPVNEYKNAGFYKVEFNGDNLSSGIYFYQMKAGNVVKVRKMVLLK